MITKFIIALVCALSLFTSEGFPSRYDLYFYVYSHRFFANSVDWRWFKAQAYAESNLDPDAVSPVGAQGIMQLMPFTSKEVAKELGIPHMPLDPRLNIMMGIYYDYKLYKYWGRCSDGIHRIFLMFASYNAGLGNIIKANRIAPTDIRCTFVAVECCLRMITGKHSLETISYVTRIRKYYKKIAGL